MLLDEEENKHNAGQTKGIMIIDCFTFYHCDFFTNADSEIIFAERARAEICIA